jgi:hypothetical protein
MCVIYNLISFHLEILTILMLDRCTVCAEHTIGLEIILDAPMVVLGDKAQVETRFGPFRDSANLYAQ